MGDADEAEEEIADRVAGGEQAGLAVSQTDGVDEDEGKVVGCHIDATARYASVRGLWRMPQKDAPELLHGLGAHAEDEAADGAGAGPFAGAPSEEVLPGNGVPPLIVDGPLDVLGLGDDVGVVDVPALQVGQDLVGFLNAALGDEPAVFERVSRGMVWRLGKGGLTVGSREARGRWRRG